MARQFRFVKSGAIELAVQRWADWLDSLEMARRQLGWRESFSEEEWTRWAVPLDQELIWNLAMSSLDTLRLPRFWAGYWIACVVSPYKADDRRTYWKIRCPSWAMSRTNMLVQEEPAERPKGYAKRVITTTGDGVTSEDGRVLPPLGLEVITLDSPSSVTIRVPLFLISGLRRDPTPLSELLKEVISLAGKHPLSELLQRVGTPVGGDWARMMISKAKVYQLRPLYKYLLQSEYDYELVESLNPEQLKRLVRSSGETVGDVLVLSYYAEQLVQKKERVKIKERVRKRVTGWFKEVGQWPLPKDEAY